MAQTKAQIEHIVTSMENLQSALTQLQNAAQQTDGIVQQLKTQGWQSTSAAPKFYSDAANWQTDHTELINCTSKLIPQLQEAITELRKAEAALGG